MSPSRPAREADLAAAAAVAEIVKSYLVGHVRQVPGADTELFDRAYALYDAVEIAHAEGRSGRLAGLMEHRALRGLLKLLGARAAAVFEVALGIMEDNRTMIRLLGRRLAESGIDPTTVKGRAKADGLYERILVDVVPLETSLANVEGMADSIDLANEYLNPKSMLKRRVFEAAWSVLLPLAMPDETLREHVEDLKTELEGDPGRLARMAALVREAGPGIVAEAYERGSVAP